MGEEIKTGIERNEKRKREITKKNWGKGGRDEDGEEKEERRRRRR